MTSGQRSVAARADAIVAELGPLIMSDQVILENLRGPDLEAVLRRIDRVSAAGFTAGIRPPVDAGSRAIVWDKYEANPGTTPNQFLSYDVRYDDQFVSPYARRHPAEDFAESFAWYLRDGRAARRVLDRGAAGATDKWDSLVQHYPARAGTGR